MKLFFCKPKYIGDALLVTGAVRAARRAHPEAEIWVAVREGTQGILEGCPDIDRIVTLSKPKEHGRTSPGWLRDLRIVLRLRRERFDHAFELSDGDRGRFVTALCGASRIHANAFFLKSALWRRVFGGAINEDYTALPRAEWDYRTVAKALGISAPAPAPVFERSLSDFSAAKTIPLGRPAIFIHPVASVAANLWGADNWAKLIASLTRHHDIILSSGPAAHEIALCKNILEKLGTPSGVHFTGAAYAGRL